MLWVVVVIAVIVFCLFGLEYAIRDIVTGKSTQVYGYYRGQPIYAEDFLVFRRRWTRLLGSRFGSDSEEFSQYLFNQLIILREAEAAGVQVTDAELLDRLKEVTRGASDTSLAASNTFDHAAYANLINRLDMTKVSFEMTLREQLMVAKYQQGMLNVVRPNDLEARISYEKDNTQVRVRYLSFRANEFSEVKEPAEEEVGQYFDANKRPPPPAGTSSNASAGRYYQPDRVAVEYAQIPFRQMLPKAVIPFAKVENQFLKNRNNYKRSDEDIKKGLSKYKSLSEVYDEIERDLKQEEAKNLARDAMLGLLRDWMDFVQKNPPAEKLDDLLERLCTKHSVFYRPVTPPFSTTESSKAGPISRARNFTPQAFRVFRGIGRQDPWTTEQALNNLSDILTSQDACFLLRIRSKKPAYEPTWEELKRGNVLDLTVDKVREDLKVSNGFELAVTEAEKFRTLLYRKAAEATAKAAGGEVKDYEISRDETAGLPSEVIDAAYKTQVGEVSPVINVENAAYFVLVQSDQDEKLKVTIVSIGERNLKNLKLDPPEQLLEYHYEMVKNQSEFQQPGEIEIEYLLAQFDSFLQDILKSEKHKTRAMDALKKALEDEVFKPADDTKTAQEKANQKDKIKALAEANGLTYAKNLDKFRSDDEAKRSNVLGKLSETTGIRQLLSELKLNQWSEIKDSPEGPFIVRVVERGDPSPVPFAEVSDQVASNYLSAFKKLEPELKASALFETKLHLALDKASDLPPIGIKTRRQFEQKNTDLFAPDKIPAELEEFLGLQKVVDKLKPGELSDVIDSDKGSLVALLTGEKDVKKVDLSHATVDTEDFKPAERDLSNDEIKSYYDRHKEEFRTSSKVEIEYVLVDIEGIRKGLFKETKDEAVRKHFDEHQSDFYEDMKFEDVKVLVKSDLAREMSRKTSSDRIQAAYREALNKKHKKDFDLAATAISHNLKYEKISYSRLQASRLEHLGGSEFIPHRAFSMEDGAFSETELTGTSQFFFRRTRLIESTPKPLDDARKDVIAKFSREKAVEKAEKWAKEVLGKTKSVGLAKAVADSDYPKKDRPPVKESGYFGKFASGVNLPPWEVTTKAFDIKKGETIGPVRSGSNLLIAIVKDQRVEKQKKLFYVIYRPSAFETPGLKATDSEASDYYKANKDSFKVSDTVQVEYVFSGVNDLAESEKVKALATEEALKAHYEAGKEKSWKDKANSTDDKPAFFSFEKVRSEVSFDFRTKEADKLSVQHIREVEKAARDSGEAASFDLKAIALKLDLKHGVTGGILKTGLDDPAGVLKDLQDVDGLADLVFKLKEGEIRADNSVSSINGRALIRLKSRTKAHIPPLSNVREAVDARIRSQKAAKEASKYARAVQQKLALAFKDLETTGSKEQTFREVVKKSSYLAESEFLPVVRSTEFFSRPQFNPQYALYFGSPYYVNVPGNSRAGPRFALGSFSIGRQEISKPISEDKDQTECFLVVLSGLRYPSKDDFNSQKGFVKSSSGRIKSAQAQQSLLDQFNSLSRTPIR